MSFVFDLPEIGEGVLEAEIVSWKVSIGEAVAIDQPLCEVMTDKATVEISSPKAGKISKFHADPGDIIKVHTPLVDIDTDGAVSATPPKSAPKEKPETAPAPLARSTPAPAPIAQNAPAPAPTPGTTRAAPAVRRHARSEGIDIHQVPGTGSRGRVTHEDVRNFTQPSRPLPLAPKALPQVAAGQGDQRVKIIGLRRKIAEQMVRSKHTAPHFTYVEEVDCTELVRLRKILKKRAEEYGIKLTYLPIIMKACSIVFREFPNVNAVMDEDAFELVVRGEHNIGFATDTPNGLFVPVIKNVESKSILQISAEMQDLAARTREGKASLDELSGGTFTITGVGAIGGVLATPILNVPEVGILGTNAIRERAMVINGEIQVRHMMMLSPSFDHRIVDGAVGARFTAALKRLLEQPESLLLEMS